MKLLLLLYTHVKHLIAQFMFVQNANVLQDFTYA